MLDLLCVNMQCGNEEQKNAHPAGIVQDSAMASLISSLESSVIESLRKSVQIFCKNAAELSFIMPSTANIKCESLPGGQQDDNQATNHEPLNSEFETSSNSNLEIIMGSSTKSPFEIETSPSFNRQVHFRSSCAAEFQPQDCLIDGSGHPCQAVDGIIYDCSTGHTCTFCKRVFKCRFRNEPSAAQSIEDNVIFYDSSNVQPTMVSIVTQTMPIKLSIAKQESISIPPEKFARSLTDSMRIACSDSKLGKGEETGVDLESKTNKTKKQLNLEKELLFDEEIKRIFTQAPNQIASEHRITRATVSSAKRKLFSSDNTSPNVESAELKSKVQRVPKIMEPRPSKIRFPAKRCDQVTNRSSSRF